MQHVSIDYMLSTFAFNINKADRDVSTRVRSIVDGCPRLRTFTLHLLTFFENEDLSRGLSASSQTAFELSKLAARLQDRNFRLEWIAIVYHGDRLALKELRNGIAPMGNWVLGMGMEWPDISIDERQKEGIRSHESGDPTQSIRTYRLCSGTCLESRRACWADGMRVSS